MQEWLAFGLLSLACWGLWGVFPKLATSHISPQSAFLFNVVGVMLVGAAVALYLAVFQPPLRVDLHYPGSLFGVLAGAAGVSGTLFLLLALSRGGNASVLVPMTALYPLITALLALVFLHEAITAKQALGMLFALVAIVLFST
jgi:transporter family protein